MRPWTAASTRPGPFADRASALLWTDALVGQLACDALLLAAVCEAQSIQPLTGAYAPSTGPSSG